MNRILFLFSLLSMDVVSGITLNNRVKAACTYLTSQGESRIYCYGGIASQESILNDMHTLNVERNEPILVSTLSTAWEAQRPINNDGLVGRVEAQVAATPDGTKMIIQGGRNQGNISLDHPFIIYDAVTNAWTRGINFSKGLPTSHIHRAAVSYIPSIHKFAFFGGFTQHVPAELKLSGVSVQPSYNGNILRMGFNHLTTYSLETNTWEEIQQVPSPGNEIYLIDFSSLHHNNTLYFFGGRYRLNDDVQNTFAEFDLITTVAFPQYAWQSISCRKDVPTSRIFHTTTLLPDKKTVLLFGGTSDEYYGLEACCYLLNLETKEWRVCDMTCTDHAARFQHAAVLVQNHVFILFGKNRLGVSMNDMVVLKVSEDSQIVAVSKYDYFGKYEEDIDSDALGAAEIAGISVGGVAFLSILGALLWYRRRKIKAGEFKDFPKDWDQDFEGCPQTKVTPPSVDSHRSTTTVQSATVNSRSIYLMDDRSVSENSLRPPSMSEPNSISENSLHPPSVSEYSHRPQSISECSIKTKPHSLNGDIVLESLLVSASKVIKPFQDP